MILLLLILLISTYLFHLLYWRRRNLPPGPVPLPLLGNFYLAKSELKPGYKIWKSLTDRYGPVYTFWMAHMPVVMVTDYQLIKQSFIKDGNSYTGRPQIPLAMQLKKGSYGLIDSYGERWVQQRRFALRVLRNFGLGKNLMEEKVIGELQSLVENVKKEQSENGKVDMQDFIDAAVGSIINTVLFGYRYDETNMKEFLELKDRMSKQMKLTATAMGGILFMYPWTAKLPFFSKYGEFIAGNWESLMNLFRSQIAEKLKTIDYDNDEYSDYVEAFLKEKKKHENEPNFGEKMEMIELLQVLIGEVQRLANLLPSNLNHQTTKEVEIGGHIIPEGTIINAQISQVLYDEKIFPEPYKFKPERFLDSEGNLLKIEEITLDPSNPSPSIEKDYGVTVRAENFKLEIKSRF